MSYLLNSFFLTGSIIMQGIIVFSFIFLEWLACDAVKLIYENDWYL